MSIVTVQIGQCGNQLGETLFSALDQHTSPEPDDHRNRRTFSGSSGSVRISSSNTYLEECRQCFFRDDGVARAVIVDTEPKAIQSIIGKVHAPKYAVAVDSAGSLSGDGTRPRAGLTKARKRTCGWRYDASTQVCCQSSGGAANNWAFGYGGHGPLSVEATLEAVRREVERCDRLAGLSILHSAAGGTGSGLGTYLTEALRDELTSAFILNTVVCAHSSGEVILQNYNTLFTLSHLASCSDGVLAIENEGANAVCRKLLRLERPSLADLNSVICDGLVGALIPAAASAATIAGPGAGAKVESERYSGGLVHFGEKLAHLCPNKDFVFLRASVLPQIPDNSKVFTSNTWEALMKRAYRMHITGALADHDLEWGTSTTPGRGEGKGPTRSVSALMTLHGDLPSRFSTPARDFYQPRLFTEWSTRPFLECRSPLRLNGHDRSLSLISNSQAVLGVLESTVGRSHCMYQAGAYVHQYAKYGVEAGDFENAFMGVEQVIQNYRSLG